MGWSGRGSEEEEEERRHGRGKYWNLPLTIMEPQLPSCCCLKALDVRMQHTKLLSEERQFVFSTTWMIKKNEAPTTIILV